MNYNLPTSNNNINFELNLNESDYITPFNIEVDENLHIRKYNKPDNYLRKNLEINIRKNNNIDKQNKIFLTAGSDSALHLIIETFLIKKKYKNLLLPLPTYKHMEVFCTKYFNVNSINFHINDTNTKIIEDIKNNLSIKKYDIIYICNPNNPTCKSFKKTELIDLFKNFPQIYFIIDEAYIEFCYENSVCNEVQYFENVVITRTFSKLYGLAGVRLGYLICNEKLYNECKEFYNPKEVTSFALSCGIKVFENHNYYEKIIKQNQISKKKNYFSK